MAAEEIDPKIEGSSYPGPGSGDRLVDLTRSLLEATGVSFDNSPRARLARVGHAITDRLFPAVIFEEPVRTAYRYSHRLRPSH